MPGSSKWIHQNVYAIEMRCFNGFWLIPFFLLTYLNSTGQDFTVSRLNTNHIQSDPGKLNTLVFRIVNHTDSLIDLTARLHLPDGWTPVMGNENFSVEANHTMTKLVSFTTPPLTAANDYTVGFEVGKPADESQLIETPVSIKIQSALSLELISSPSFIMAGDTSELSYILRNKSNVTQKIALTLNSGHVRGASVVELAPDSMQIVNVIIPTLENLSQSEQRSIRLEAAIQDSVGTNVISFQRLRIIPTQAPKPDLFHRFPVTASMIYLQRNQGDITLSGYQFDVFGSGSIGIQNMHQLEFRFRGPDRFQLSVLGQYEEYYATYKGKNMRVSLGDRNYSLSPLTENSRYGRGMELSYRAGKTEFGGFYHKPRFIADIKEIYAGYFNYHFNSNNHIGLHYLQKEHTAEIDPSHLMSITSSLNPFRNLNLFAEASYGSHGKQAGKGLHLGFDFRARGLSVSSYVIHADKFYPGYYTNTTTWSGNLNYSLTKKWRIMLNARHDDRNAARDTLFGTSPYREYYRAGVGFHYSKSGNIRAYATYNKSEDRAEKKLFHYDQKYIRLELTQAIQDFQLRFYNNYGVSQNFLLDDTNIGRSVLLYGSIAYKPGSRLSLSTFASFQRDNRYSQILRDYWYFGGDVSSWITPSTFFSLRFQNNYSVEEYYRDRSLFDLRFNQRFLRNHEISAMARYALIQKFTDESDLSLAIKYTWRVGMPFKRKDKTGVMVSGKVENLGTESVEGIILNLNGYTTTTDTEGNFIFYNVQPGVYLLSLDPASVRFMEITDTRLPMTLIIEPDTDKHIHFGLTTGSTISGRLILPELENGNSLIFPRLKDVHGQGREELFFLNNRLIVEARKKDEVIRLMTDQFGNFEFKSLRPGTWTIEVYSNGLSNDLQIEQTLYVLELKPGDKQRINVNLKNRERKIRYVEPPANSSGK